MSKTEPLTFPSKSISLEVSSMLVKGTPVHPVVRAKSRLCPLGLRKWNKIYSTDIKLKKKNKQTKKTGQNAWNNFQTSDKAKMSSDSWEEKQTKMPFTPAGLPDKLNPWPCPGAAKPPNPTPVPLHPALPAPIGGWLKAVLSAVPCAGKDDGSASSTRHSELTR